MHRLRSRRILLHNRAECVGLTRLEFAGAERMGCTVPVLFTAGNAETLVAFVSIRAVLDGCTASAAEAFCTLLKGIVEQIAVRIGLCLTGVNHKGRDGLCRQFCGEAAVRNRSHADRSRILICGGTVGIHAGDLLTAVHREVLIHVSAALVDRNNCNRTVFILERGNEDIACGLFRRIHADSARTHKHRILTEAVAALGNLTLFIDRAVAALDIPHNVGVHIADDQTVVDILRLIERLRIRLTANLGIRHINLGHPDVLAAVFHCREIHCAALCAIEMCSEKVTVCHCLLVIQDGIVVILAVAEALRRHQFGIGAGFHGLTVIRDKVCCTFRRPVRPVI